MNYEVSEKKGGCVRVGLREIGEGVYEVTLDGETFRVDAARNSRSVYSLIEAGRQFEAMVDEQGTHGFDVTVGGRLFHLEAVDERTKRLSGQAAQVVTGPQNVEAEMPGKVVEVTAAVGDTVAQGQGLIVIEAMKMENQIVSPIDGVVKQVAVSEGETVEAGSPLFTVEPAADAS
ncbi:MAG: biotin/lipoyl-containing protein [Myxococcota bacterium]|jgi:biotin carboxyl carrier protein|nr:acetyl-CoA carboxylase biotin carboxyl carrier protein subunit [Deltaproteobacteria bacterium]MCP4244048.1 biotin/lipoyl-binding protein [bacterium]MDP6076310.1 biotin/lipoyl-containing protein [Myxococcota bacterium]MDP6244457.1 biotin/lipoyl-containing protein [Myxococcota bacterium]MDP7074844.1 biotin/lipoyl-containing protein [Myxococcota bacterium]